MKPHVRFAFAASVTLPLGLLQAQSSTQPQPRRVSLEVAGLEFEVPEGFVIERVNPVDKRDSYVVLTFDAQGRPVVSKENDFPRRLIDADGDGVFEGEQVITDKIRNAHGLWFDGGTLYALATPVISRDQTARELAQAAAAAKAPRTTTLPGSGIRQGMPVLGDPTASGLFKATDADGDGVAEGFDTVIRLVGTIQEHGPHAIRRGPDGAPYYISGNLGGTPPDQAIDPDTLVIAEDEAQFLPYLEDFGVSQRDGVHSAIYRLDPATKKLSIFNGGNRNAYDFAFNLAGEAFLYDSDMEWDQNMPWYRDVRTVHATLGGNLGYRNGSGKLPPFYLDTLPPIRDLGRGSPVGVETYQSYAYPAEYFDNLLEADWSRGRLLYTALTPQGATFGARTDRAELVHGEPFNVTDVEVGPDGNVYFTTGGRMSSGGVWRLRYTGPKPAQPDQSGILAVVRQPQPLSAWGWAAIEQVKASLGEARFAAELERVARDAAVPALDRARALYELQRHGPKPSAALLKALISDREPAVRAAVVYLAGLNPGADSVPVASAGLKDRDPVVKRRSAEAFLRLGQTRAKPSLAPVDDVIALLSDPDRFVRWAARTLLERTPREAWADKVMKVSDPAGAIEGLLAWVRTAPEGRTDAALQKQLMLAQTNLSVDDQLRLLRLYQVTAMKTSGGVKPEVKRQFGAYAASRFPATDDRLNRELAFVMADAGEPAAVGAIWAAMPAGNAKQQLQMEYMYALRMLKDGWTADSKQKAVEWFARAVTWRGGASATAFLGKQYGQILEVFTAEEQTLANQRVPKLAPSAMAKQDFGKIVEAFTAPPKPGEGPPSVETFLTRGPGLSRQELFDELIFTPESGPGADFAGPNLTNPRTLFEAKCASCHEFNGAGNRYGPSLTGRNLSRREIVEAIIFPSRNVDSRYHTTVVRTKDGRTLKGLLISEDATALRLKTTADREPVTVAKSDVSSTSKEATSIMPEELFNDLKRTDYTPLVRFLQGQP